MRTSHKVFGFFGIVIAIYSPLTIYAQDTSKVTFLIGPIGGYNLVSYKTDAFTYLYSYQGPFVGSEQNLATAENGKGTDISFGISSEIPLTVDGHDFLIIEAIYDSKSANFTTTYDATAPDTAYSLAATLTYILVNFGFKYNFMTGTTLSGLGVQLCASVGIKYSGIYRPTSIPPQHFGTLGVIENATELRFALRPELTYDIPLTSRFIFTPSLGYDYPLTKVDVPENWTASSAYGAISLRYAFGSF